MESQEEPKFRFKSTPIGLMIIILAVPCLTIQPSLGKTNNAPGHSNRQPTSRADGSAPEYQYGFSTRTVQNLLMADQIEKLRTLMAETPPHSGDADYRKLLEAAALAADNDFERATVIFEKLKNLDKADPYIVCLAARSYANMQQPLRAIALCSTVIAKHPWSYPYTIRAGCYMELGRYADAAQDYLSIGKLEPATAESNTAKAAKALLDGNNPALGLKLIDQYLAKNGAMKGATIRGSRALCLAKLGRYQEAADAFSESIIFIKRTVKNDLERTAYLNNVYSERAKCYDKLGKTTQAAADRQTVRNLSNDAYKEMLGK